MLMSSAKLMMMMANGKMMTPINKKVQMPDISAPGSVMLYQRIKRKGWLQQERGQKGGARTSQERFFWRAGDAKSQEGKSSTQRKVKPE